VFQIFVSEETTSKSKAGILYLKRVLTCANAKLWQIVYASGSGESCEGLHYCCQKGNGLFWNTGWSMHRGGWPSSRSGRFTPPEKVSVSIEYEDKWVPKASLISLEKQKLLSVPENWRRFDSTVQSLLWHYSYVFVVTQWSVVYACCPTFNHCAVLIRRVYSFRGFLSSGPMPHSQDHFCYLKVIRTVHFMRVLLYYTKKCSMLNT
jgi:hypothetical protein